MRDMTLTALLLLAASGLWIAQADTLTCYLASDDHDGDGYAAGSAAQSVTVPAESHLTCPAGYVPGMNDGDDNDPDVHPRRVEMQYNGKDDNCNGLIDEPQYLYADSASGITTTSFQWQVKINDQETVNARGGLYASIEYARLADPLVRYRTEKEKVTVTLSDDGRYYATLTLSGLEETTVYMARVQFYRRTMLAQAPVQAAILVDPLTRRETWRLATVPRLADPDMELAGRVIFPFPDRPTQLSPQAAPLPPRRPGVGGRRGGRAQGPPAPAPMARAAQVQLQAADQTREASPWRIGARRTPQRFTPPATRVFYEAVGAPSDWYYDTTTGTADKSIARTHIVHKALANFGDSEAGRVGILGTQRINGERYCGNDREYWCSEYYAYAAKNWLDGIADAACVADLVDYFSAAYYSESQVTDADRGDYVSFGDYHSGMFLALDKRGSNNPANWYIWTCEGNASDSRRFNDEGTYVRHVPGNTAHVLYRPLTDAEFGFGHILTGHLK